MATKVPLGVNPGMTPDHDQPLPQRGAFSIAEWCRYRGICPATFYNHLQRGEMPAVLKIGRRTIITAEADAEWRLRMERQAVIEPPPITDCRAPCGRPAGFPSKIPDRRVVRA
jgi:hypothetical protein